MKRLIFIALLSSVAHAQILGPIMSGSPFGPGYPGFLSTTSVTNNVTNACIASQTFTNATYWVPNGITAAAPTITGGFTAPDSTNTAARMVMPSVSGAGNRSILFEGFGSPASAPALTNNQPYTVSLYVKGAVGGETIWIETSIPYYSETKIVATTSWQRFTLTFMNRPGASTAQYLAFGTDLGDPAQTATPAQTVYIWGCQVELGQYAGTYIPTTTAPVTQSQTKALPSGIAFRDFSTLTGFNSGNPILSPGTGAYNAWGVQVPRTFRNSKIGSTWYSTAGCGPSSNNWLNICLYESTDLTTWTDPGSTLNPINTNTASTWKDHYLLHTDLAPACSIDIYCVYYSAENASGVPSIGLMHSSDLQHWTDYASNPIITSTTAGSGGQVPNPMLPSVIQVGSTLIMYTAAECTSYCNNYIVYWTSPATDGINWTYGGVALSPAGSGDWDFGAGAFDPYVFVNNHGFCEMAYTANANFGLGSGQQEVGYAISKDCKNFYRYQAGPILAPTTTAFPLTLKFIGDGLFYENNGIFYVYSDADDAAVSGAKGYLATMVDH